ncbi:MAG: cytochrome PufQ [Paracoccaceae bacterium]
MTDLTNHAVQDSSPRARKTPKAEFTTYFALIFLATLPLSTLTWCLGVLRTGSFDRKSPLKSAWSQARIITPMIFHG